MDRVKHIGVTVVLAVSVAGPALAADNPVELTLDEVMITGP
jgi:hypothetical protein